MEEGKGWRGSEAAGAAAKSSGRGCCGVCSRPTGLLLHVWPSNPFQHDLRTLSTGCYGCSPCVYASTYPMPKPVSPAQKPSTDVQHYLLATRLGIDPCGC